VGKGGRLVGVAVGIGVLVGRGVLVGGRAVLVGTSTTGEVGLGRTIGVPWAAEVCWAVRVWAAAVYIKFGLIVGCPVLPGKLQAVRNRVRADKKVI